MRCLGLGTDLFSDLLLVELDEDEEDVTGISLLSSLLAVSELPDPELTPLDNNHFKNNNLEKLYAWRRVGVCLEKRRFMLGEEKVYA